MKATQQPQQHDGREFRLYLQEELVRRCQKNPNYSLRAFAKTLNISAAALSDMLNNKRSITPTMKTRLGLALGLNPEELVKYHATSKRSHAAGQSLRAEFQQLTLDTYAVISDWYHYAILELIRVKSFKPDPQWIARALGITKSEVNIAVERLQRVGLLEIDETGIWFDKSQSGYATNINGNLTSQASKKLQKQILELSMKALEEVPIDLRNHTSITVALNPEDLPEARELIKHFRRDLGMFFEKNSNPTQVYNLGISLYPITNFKEFKNEDPN